MNRRTRISLGSCLMIAVLMSGCATVQVTSDPSGAKAYNACGLAECGTIFRDFKPYDHVEGTFRGLTPCKYNRLGGYAYDNVRVEWPDGTRSAWEQQTDPPWRFFWRRHLKFHFTKEQPENKRVEPGTSGDGVPGRHHTSER